MNKFLTVLVVVIILVVGFLAVTYHGTTDTYQNATSTSGYQFPTDTTVSSTTVNLTGSSTSSTGSTSGSAGTGTGTAGGVDAGGLPTNSETSVRVGQSVNLGDLYVTINKVLEDSRCPAGVQCIQAGRVVVSATVSGQAAPASYTLSSDKPALVQNEQIVLSVISPDKKQNVTINAADYTFGLSIFKVSNSQ